MTMDRICNIMSIKVPDREVREEVYAYPITREPVQVNLDNLCLSQQITYLNKSQVSVC